jgi:hypothetical protein
MTPIPFKPQLPVSSIASYSSNGQIVPTLSLITKTTGSTYRNIPQRSVKRKFQISQDLGVKFKIGEHVVRGFLIPYIKM